jgi:hypothetical protein
MTDTYLDDRRAVFGHNRPLTPPRYNETIVQSFRSSRESDRAGLLRFRSMSGIGECVDALIVRYEPGKNQG